MIFYLVSIPPPAVRVRALTYVSRAVSIDNPILLCPPAQMILDDAGLLNGLQAVVAWNEYFDYPKGTTLGLYAASLYIPSIVTAYLGDFLSQHYGRRYALAIGSIVVLAGSFINAFAINSRMWVAGKSQSIPSSKPLPLSELV